MAKKKVVKTKKIPKKYSDDGKIAVCMAVRNNLPYLKKALRSLHTRKSGNINVEYFIYNDGSTDGLMDWLVEWRVNHPDVKLTVKSNPKTEREHRKGITGGTLEVMKMVKKSKITRYWLVHADMIFPFDWDVNMIEYMSPRRIVSATRIEPPDFPAEKCKIQKAFGSHIEDFTKWQELKYLWYIWKDRVFTKAHLHQPTKGFFAPYGGFVCDWWAHPVDINIGVQSTEETDLAFRARMDGYDLLQTWKVLVYHFGGKGDRFKSKDLSVMDRDWASQNEMSTQNFIRKWGQLPIHDEWSFPTMLYPEKRKLALNLIVRSNENADLMKQWLNYHEPWFDEIVILIDTQNGKGHMEKTIMEFIESKKDKKYHYYFDENKFKVFSKKLNKDFGKAHNFMIGKTKTKWIVHIDSDEQFPVPMLQGMRGVIPILEKNSKTVCAFPRLNLVDGKAFNPENLDRQCRLYDSKTKWVNKVHEIPERIKNRTEFPPAICDQFGKIMHAKSSNKHNNDQKFYDTIESGAGNKRV